MPEMKGITVKIPADLHAEVKAYLEAHGITMGEFIAQAVDHELHPNLEQEDKRLKHCNLSTVPKKDAQSQAP